MMFEDRRRLMVDHQIAARGITSGPVLRAMAAVPREAFVPENLRDYAYEDRPLPIGEGQTISQPYIVALMVDALDLGDRTERVLEIGAGSGYAAGVLASVADEVVTIERHEPLVRMAEANLARAGITNARVVHGDGTRGCPDKAPFDGIIVAAGGPRVPDSLRRQLKVGGSLVIPVGPAQRLQTLLRITRTGEDTFEEEDLGAVQFVPLIGSEGWEGDDPSPKPRAEHQREGGNGGSGQQSVPHRIAAACEPFDDLETADLDPLLDRIGDARVVLIGEASHGTSEFYRMRARITQALIEQKGFRIVAAEADWPDAARVDAWVRHHAGHEVQRDWQAFARFPVWMWRNAETRTFINWLHARNADRAEDARAGFHGLDMYSLYTSIEAVLKYLDDVDPETAQVARERYACLMPWQHEPAEYGHMALTSGFARCREPVVNMLRDLLQRRTEYAALDGVRLFDAEQNARLIESAERYYRIMYEGGAASWNLRDSHMFETLRRLLDHYGPDSRAVVWAHNSHVGDASATGMSARGEHNIGQLCREAFGDASYHIGFGTHAGTVAAAHNWDGEMQVMDVRPSLADSHERLCHDSGVRRFFLPLRNGPQDLRDHLQQARLERAIGVIYRPETERWSHYFDAILPRQFDEWIWFDESRAVTPIAAAEVEGLPETYPFGL
ncbi:protein-L-isoaspartate(D-aspartate) O-methyltransferase [Caenispirillum salinarum]|uniref:protein-L-isoaspartate(D-aspartate) O-methyltransferase n=1 Tax=Caenispirillum salinarum TaxID=859058 RepID=UPI003850B192